MADVHEPSHHDADRDTADLAKFGYKQELKRTLGGLQRLRRPLRES